MKEFITVYIDVVDSLLKAFQFVHFRLHSFSKDCIHSELFVEKSFRREAIVLKDDRVPILRILSSYFSVKRLYEYFSGNIINPSHYKKKSVAFFSLISVAMRFFTFDAEEPAPTEQVNTCRTKHAFSTSITRCSYLHFLLCSD